MPNFYRNKILKIIYGLISLILTTSVYANDPEQWNDWDLIAITEKDSFLQFSPKEIITEGKYKKAWIREVYYKTKSQLYTMSLMQINCSAKTLHIVTKTTYSGSGVLVSHQELPKNKVLTPPPGTIGAITIKTICSGKSSFYDSIK